MSGTKTVGVIGGLGPAASADFYARLTARTQAERDQDHLRVLIDSNPHIPDRNAAAEGRGPSPGPALAAAARGLQMQGAQLVVMACNAAHGWVDDIRAAIDVPFLSMVEETAAIVPGPKAGVLAADAALRLGLYQRALAHRGVEPLTLGAERQKAFMAALYELKAGRPKVARREFRTLALELIDAGAQSVIAGCTEVPLVLAADDLPVPLISSTEVLVERTIVAAGGRLRPV
jgi:aspartate racemase